MNLDKLVLIFLCIWALLTGLFSVTNLQVTWGPQVLGFSALACGICCLVRLLKGGP